MAPARKPDAPAQAEETLPHDPTPSQSGAATDVPPVAEQRSSLPPEVPGEKGPTPLAFPTLVGQSFGDFEILEELGRGGMGVVYKARQKSLDRFVALKMLLGAHFQNPALLTRFLAEARASASLAHPNIVTIHQVGECAAGRFIVMELIDGQTLEDIIRDRAVPVSWAVSIMVRVTDAVHYAHTKGIVHRDLKPANIMIDKLRRPVVMDFGIAKFLGKPSSLTQQGAVIGTPAYMPPEQADEGVAQVGPHSDVYSLGAVLYTLLTGKVPFDAGSPLQTLVKVISAEPPAAVRKLRPEVPVELEQIVMKSLSKRPEDRQQSAKALADDLRRCRASPPPPIPVPVTTPPALPRVLLVSPTSKKVTRVLPGTTVIGRSSECDVVLKGAEVSKRHCQLTLEGSQVVLEDLNSANGTLVNDEPVKRKALKDGDELDIGGYLFRIQIQKPRQD